MSAPALDRQVSVACSDFLQAPFGNLCKNCQKAKSRHAGFEDTAPTSNALEMGADGELKQPPRKKRSHAELQAEFALLVQKDFAEQEELFLKSFIFALPDWKEIGTLSKAFQKYALETQSGETDLDFVQAADFLQKNGKTRTAAERKLEVEDVDLDNNKRIAFVEYLLLHFKVMVLTEYYKRMEQTCPHDLSKGGIGISGVGYELLDELFYIPSSLPGDLARALEEVTEQKTARNAIMKQLQSESGMGVKGGLAAAKLAQMMAEPTPIDQLKTEARINSALRKGPKSAGAQLEEQKRKEKAAADAARRASRNKLKAKAKLWS
jgi:hypothetical protein